MFETDERNKHYSNTGIMQSYSSKVEYKNLELEMSRKCPVSVKKQCIRFSAVFDSFCCIAIDGWAIQDFL